MTTMMLIVIVGAWLGLEIHYDWMKENKRAKEDAMIDDLGLERIV